MTLRKQFGLACLATVMSALAIAEQAQQLELTQGWIRVGPPSQTMTAGYGDLRNTGLAPITLVAANTPIARSTELHTMSVNAEGMMLMQAMPELVIAPGEVLQFAPHGKHFMLIGLVGPVEVGRQYPIEIHFSDGSSVVIGFNARSS